MSYLQHARLEMAFFSQLKNNPEVTGQSLCVMLCNAISIHVTASTMTRRAHGDFAVVCLSFAEMKTNKDTRYKQTYCRPDYILDRIDIWCRF